MAEGHCSCEVVGAAGRHTQARKQARCSQGRGAAITHLGAKGVRVPGVLVVQRQHPAAGEAGTGGAGRREARGGTGPAGARARGRCPAGRAKVT